MDELKDLQQQIKNLRNENRLLRELLNKNHIPFSDTLENAKHLEPDEYIPNQGSRIMFPTEITEEMANHFYARFWGVAHPVDERLAPTEAERRPTGCICQTI